MGCLHLARATIFARVAGLGEGVILLWGLWHQGGSLWVRPQLVECLRENRSLRCLRGISAGSFHQLILSGLVACEIYFIRLRRLFSVDVSSRA